VEEDKYMQMSKMLKEMPEEKRMEKVAEFTKMCVCPSCPSYTGTSETGRLFCAKGKSSIITEEKGCTCAGCPVTPVRGLTKIYFCTKGSEAQQRGMM
jgi:hypothetical protein